MDMDYVPPTDAPAAFLWDVAPQILAVKKPGSLTISCGAHGHVVISMGDGSVSYRDCTPDEGAVAFWDAVKRMFPGAVK